jgi:RimJ/RimL family protein N-acetyltransferase
VASQRVMERAGFVRIETDEDLLHYELGRKP